MQLDCMDALASTGNINAKASENLNPRFKSLAHNPPYIHAVADVSALHNPELLI